VKWFYADAGRQMGPVEESTLDDLVRTGVVRDDTLVWHEGMPGWQPHMSARGAARPVPPAIPAPGADFRYCSECGRPFPADQVVTIGAAPVCAGCKPLYLQRMREGAGGVVGAPHYGGFWMRFLARMIDYVLLGMVNFVLLFALGRFVIRPDLLAMQGVGAAGGGFIGASFIAAYLVLILVTTALAAIYEGYFVSTRGGTIGKLVVGLKIIRSDGRPLSFGLAVGRYFAQIVSGMVLYIGYIMAGFDSQKRALHDYICDTRVIYGSR